MAFQVSLPKVALGERVSVFEVGFAVIYYTIILHIIRFASFVFFSFFFVACLSKLT